MNENRFMTFGRWIIAALFAGTVFGMLVKPEPSYVVSTSALRKAGDVDYVLGQCRAMHPKEECVLVALPVSKD